jgi:2-methylcitrate dehydratase PrpD
MTSISAVEQPASDALDASHELAEHFARTRFEDIPPDTIRATKRRVVDLVGCAIGGARAGGNEALVELLRRQGQAPHATLLGQGGQLCAADAAMVNAITARSYDFEVMTTVVAGRIYPSHTSPTTVMTALALAEREDCSGAEFLTALTLGDDLVARLLGAAGFDFGQGWDAASVHSGVGAAAIGARLLGLTGQGIADAMGMSVNLLGGTIQAAWDGSMDFKLPQGLAARHGVLCAELAQAGWTGLEDALLSPFGFYRQFTSGCKHPEILTSGLGRSYYAEEYFKPYPACAATHSAIECALALRERPDFDLKAVRRITVRLAQQLLSNFCIKPYEPRRFPHCDAIFSYRFQVANALLNGTTIQDHYDEAALRNPALIALAGMIDLEPLDADSVGGSAAGGRCSISASMAGGSTTRQDVLQLSRHPATRPSTDAEIEAKFRQQLAFAGRGDEDRTGAIIAQIYSLEELGSVRELVRSIADLR